MRRERRQPEEIHEMLAKDGWIGLSLPHRRDEPGVELTNNRAERALREHVVLRIIGTLRNEKGMRIHETIMTMLATWKQNGLDPYEEMHKALRS